MVAVLSLLGLLAGASPAPPPAGEPGLRFLPEPRTDLTVSVRREGAALPAERPSEPLLRAMIAETAAAQVRSIDPAWEEAQRDCAGLVRFAWRTAYRRLAPARVEAGLFRDEAGAPSQFADAATLLRRSFAPMGRGTAARASLRAGDLAAFSREEEGAPVLHLMIVVRADDPAHGPAQVVYHPGEKGAGVRAGPLDALARDAPAGWRPVPENPLFLGFYRWKEWTP
jgi:uncharacterized protein YfaT (DUF1175 family)